MTKTPHLVRIGLTLMVVLVLGSLPGCTPPGREPARHDDPIKPALAERVADLTDTGPDGPQILLPGSPDPWREFAAALALAPYETAVPYLAQLSGQWSDPDSLYGPSGQLSTEVEATRLAAVLARSGARYRAALFPADRIAALRRRVAHTHDPASRSSLSQTLALLDGHGTTDCGRLAAALRQRDLAAVSRLVGPAPQPRCGTPPQAALDIARTEAARARTEILGWQVPDPQQILDLQTRIGWVAGYPPAAFRSALAPVADALAAYLTRYAEASAPFPPNISPVQQQILFDLIRDSRPQWRPAKGYVAQLTRTLRWSGRLPERVRNDPITFVYSLDLLTDTSRPEVTAALSRLRAEVLQAGDGTALDRGLRAIAAHREDLITDDVLTTAAHEVGGDARTGARLAALVLHRGECPARAGRVLAGLQRAIPKAGDLPANSVYYYALITRARTHCPGGTPQPPVSGRLRAASEKYADQATAVLARPDWSGWVQLWLLAEASCSLGRPPTLDAPRVVQAARTMLGDPTGQVWSTFDPDSAYALRRSLDIAQDGCQGAWFAPAP